MVAGDKDNPGTGSGLVEDVLDDIAVDLGPVPAGLHFPDIEYVTNQKQEV